MWARNGEQAKEHLLTGDVVECSLDHDLGYQNVALTDGLDLDDWDVILELVYDTELDKEDTGFDLVVWMCEHKLVPPTVTIHSLNLDGARWMAACLNQNGYDCYLAPYGQRRVR